MQPTAFEGRAWLSFDIAAQESAPRAVASHSSSCSSSKFHIDTDLGIETDHPFDNLLRSGSVAPGDHLASQDQDTSWQQDRLQIPTSMDPVIDTSQGFLQDPSTTLWLQQQQQTLQRALALPQGDLIQQQQPLDPTQLWVHLQDLQQQAALGASSAHLQGLQQQAALDASSAQLQLQALQQGNSLLDAASAQLQLEALLQDHSALIDLSGLSVSLQGGSLMPMQQQGNNGNINGLPVVLQVQDTAPGQKLHFPPSNTPVTMQHVQQQQLLAGGAPKGGPSTDPGLHLQLQQLQQAVQQLSSQTAEVQRVLATQVSQAQASQGQTVLLSMEGRLHAATSCSKITSMLSAQMATGTANSPVSSHSGYDSTCSVCWHGPEPLSNSNSSSPSLGAMQQQHRSSRVSLAASAAPNGAGSHSSSNMPCMVSTPEMPQCMIQHQQQQQQPGQGQPCFSHALPGAPVSFRQGQVLPGSGDRALNNQNWPAGAGLVQHQQQQQLVQGPPCFSHTLPGPPVSFSQGQVLPGTGGPDMNYQNLPAGAGMVQHQQQQQPGQGAPGFSWGIPGVPVSFRQGQVLPGSGDRAFNHHNWSAGAGMVSASTGTPMTIPQPPARRTVGPQGCRIAHKAVYDRYPGVLPKHQHQAGGISAPTGSGAHIQHPFRGNIPFGCAKGPHSQHSQGSAGRITPVNSTVAADSAGSMPASCSKGHQHNQGSAGNRSDLTPVSSTVSTVAADSAADPGPRFFSPWGEISLEVGLKQLWSAEELAGSRGGGLYNVQQLAWHPEGSLEFTPQDMYNFQKLKRMVQKLDAVHKSRIKLIKRIHAVAEHGECDLKGVYRELRGLIGEMLRDSSWMIKSLEQSRVTGVVRLALMMQEALKEGPAGVLSTTAVVLSPIPAQPTVQVQSAVTAQAVQCS